MHGLVLAFRPGTKSGAILTDGGEVYAFDGPSPGSDLQGGDVVSFEAVPSSGSHRRAQNVCVLERWAERIAPGEQPAVRELHRLLQPVTARP